MAKKIYVTFSDGKSYSIPAEFVANARAKYYADADVKRGAKGTFAEIFNQEFEYTMNDETELMDWLENNMNWEDVKEVAMYVEERKREADYYEEFGSAEKEIEDD